MTCVHISVLCEIRQVRIHRRLARQRLCLVLLAVPRISLSFLHHVNWALGLVPLLSEKCFLHLLSHRHRGHRG